MESYERIRHLRKNLLKISQEVFATNINISRSNLANIETNKVSLTNRVISDICSIYSVSADWLVDGKEPVFIEKNSKALEIARIYELLDEDNQKYLQGYIDRLLEEQNSNQSLKN